MKKIGTAHADTVCNHIPHNPDTHQTICELCGKEIEPKNRGSSNKWVEIEEQVCADCRSNGPNQSTCNCNREDL